MHNKEFKDLYLWLGTIRVIREEGETCGTRSRETHAFFCFLESLQERYVW